MQTLLVRLKPYDPRRGFVLRRYTYRGIKFHEERGWYRVDKAVAHELVGFRFHAGVLAAGIRASGPGLRDVCQSTRDRLTLVIAVRVIDRQNVGALIRAAAAFGADAVVFGPQCSDPFSRRALRVSMGNGFFLPVCQVSDLRADLHQLRQATGMKFFATVLDDTATPLPDLAAGDKCGFLFGNESYGLSADWIDFCDAKITIPMQGRTDSLNVGFSAGIVLYEHTRGRLGGEMRSLPDEPPR